MITSTKNRQNGIYYTTLFNPFKSKVFKRWVRRHHLAQETVLEPFAGANSIIAMLQEVGLAKKYASFDLYPAGRNVVQRDTIRDYPQGYTLCVTNPPWLYKSSAKRRGLAFPDAAYDNMYKLCLSLALQHNQYVAALIPASFIQANLFHHRLETIIFLNRPLFVNTDNPVSLALFGAHTHDIQVYNDDTYIDTYDRLRQHLPPKSTIDITFNNPSGSLGFVAIDNNREPSIKFCIGTELQDYHVGHSSRSITRIRGLDCTQSFVDKLNTRVCEVRARTHDVFLTAFKGLRKDGKYRRRMEYALARDIIAGI